MVARGSVDARRDGRQCRRSGRRNRRHSRPLRSNPDIIDLATASIHAQFPGIETELPSGSGQGPPPSI